MFQSRLEIQPEESSSPTAEDAIRSSMSRRLYNKTKSFNQVKEAPPKFIFNATCSGVPQDLYVGQKLQFEVIIKLEHNGQEKQPEVTLDYTILTLIAQTSGPIAPSHIEVLQQKSNSIKPSGPFLETQNWTKAVDFGTLGYIPSAYGLEDVSESYKLRLEIQFHAAGQTVGMKRELPVQVHMNPSAAASRQGSIVQIGGDEGGGEDLPPPPSYEEVMGGRR